MRSEGIAPKKWRTNSWFLLHDNAPAYRSVLVKDFLAKDNVTILKHPTVSSDLASADFYPFPRLKSALKGWHFFDATDITKNATEELKRLSHNGFQECFPTPLQWLAEEYSCARGLILRKCSLSDYCFVFLRNEVIAVTF
jgi:hypothetical protein